MGILYIAVNKIFSTYISYTSPHWQSDCSGNEAFDTLEQMYEVLSDPLATPLADGPPLAAPAASEALKHANQSSIFSIISLS